MAVKTHTITETLAHSIFIALVTTYSHWLSKVYADRLIFEQLSGLLRQATRPTRIPSKAHEKAHSQKGGRSRFRSSGDRAVSASWRIDGDFVGIHSHGSVERQSPATRNIRTSV